MTLNFQKFIAFLHFLGMGFMGPIKCSSSFHYAFGASDFSWHLVNRQWSWASAHLLYQRSILLTQCPGKHLDHLLGFHASPLCECWVKMVEDRSMPAPNVMISKVEYYNPDSKTRL